MLVLEWHVLIAPNVLLFYIALAINHHLRDELNKVDAKVKRQIRRIENQLYSWGALGSCSILFSRCLTLRRGYRLGWCRVWRYAIECARHVERKTNYLFDHFSRGKVWVYSCLTMLKTVLGRNSETSAVDIDLSLEGPATRISRWQGVIKLKHDGFFYFYNQVRCFNCPSVNYVQGKRSVTVNGTEVRPSTKHQYAVRLQFWISSL